EVCTRFGSGAKRDRLRLGKAHRARIVDRRIALYRVDQSRTRRHVVLARRQTIDAKRTGVVGLIGHADREQPPAAAFRTIAQDLYSRADRWIAEFIEHTAEDRTTSNKRNVPGRALTLAERDR